jgi:hypothetical protein
VTYTVELEGGNTDQLFVVVGVFCEEGDLVMTGGCLSKGPPESAQAVYLLSSFPGTDGLNGWTCKWHKPVSWGYGFSAYAVCIDVE